MGRSLTLALAVGPLAIEGFTGSVRPNLGARSFGAAVRLQSAVMEDLEDFANPATGETCALETLSTQSCFAWDTPPFKTVMSANRAEIAVRINRAATELNMKSGKECVCAIGTYRASAAQALRPPRRE